MQQPLRGNRDPGACRLSSLAVQHQGVAAAAVVPCPAPQIRQPQRDGATNDRDPGGSSRHASDSSLTDRTRAVALGADPNGMQAALTLGAIGR